MGSTVGADGSEEGIKLGHALGNFDGIAVGLKEGTIDGMTEGRVVGFDVAIIKMEFWSSRSNIATEIEMRLIFLIIAINNYYATLVEYCMRQIC